MVLFALQLHIEAVSEESKEEDFFSMALQPQAEGEATPTATPTCIFLFLCVDLPLDMSAVSLSHTGQSGSGTKNQSKDPITDSRQPNVDTLQSPTNPNPPHAVPASHGWWL